MKKRDLFSHTSAARFNVGAWEDTDSGSIFLISREVQRAGGEGEPDKGKLVLLELNREDEIVHERVIWEPSNDALTLEDPRALVLEDGSIVIGLTAVLRDKDGYKPFPAITRLKTKSWKEALPSITLVETFGPGKNITPIDDHTFFFRPDSLDYSHKLIVFSFQDLMAKKIQELEFPKDLEWASWRVGTSMPPLWIDENKALMIFSRYKNTK